MFPLPSLAARPRIGHITPMLHIMKLAVGVRDVAHLQALQDQRRADDPPLRHLTRSFPRRAVEIVDGGSMFWVVAGAMVVRQRIIDIVAATYDDGSACAAFHFDAALVPVAGRPTRPFQGWRYLGADAAPPDLTALQVRGADAMPESLRRGLRELGLL
jgi:hypothetical protein